MVHPDTPLSSIKGLGKVYTTQTICLCKGGTVACLCEHVAPLFREADAEEAIVRWACECARNPRAGQAADNGYVVPEFNTRVARTLVETLVHATADRQQFEKARHRVVPSPAWLMILHGVLKKLPQPKKDFPEPDKEINTTSLPNKKIEHGAVPARARQEVRKRRKAE